MAHDNLQLLHYHRRDDIHSTFWHNNFGEEMSHGCVNAAPEDAKWVFRWTDPIVPINPGDLTIGMPGGKLVEVIDS